MSKYTPEIGALFTVGSNAQMYQRCSAEYIKSDTVEYIQSPTWKQEGIWHTCYFVTYKITRCAKTNKTKSVELLKD